MLKKYFPFIGLCLGFFVVIMDTTTVPLIYTTLMSLFKCTPIKVAWVNNVYLITYAAFLLLGGRLGDFTNRKNVVLIAYVILAVGSALSGAGQTLSGIVLGRALMGIGAGLLTPQSMAYISILFANGGRGTALGIWGAVAGIATATGPVVAQTFLTIADWRWVMWVNIPAAVICFFIALISLPHDPGPGIKFKDTAISSLYGICLVGAILGLQLISLSNSTIAIGATLLIVSISSAIFLIKNELKKKNNYILSTELWFDKVFLRTCLISGLLGLSLTAFYLPLVFLLDVRMNFGPIDISVIMVIIALSNALTGPFAGNFSDRLKPEIIIRLGLILFAVSNALLGIIGLFFSGGALAFSALCVAMVMGGVGTGLAFVPLANLALGRAQIATVGRAAAFYNCVRQVSSALGGVMIAIIFDAIIRLRLQQNLEITTTSLHKFSNVTAFASFICFIFIALGLFVAAFLSKENKQKLAG